MTIVTPAFAPTAPYRFVVDERGSIIAVLYLHGTRFLRAGEAD